MKKIIAIAVTFSIIGIIVLAAGCNPSPKSGLKPPTSAKDQGPPTFVPEGMNPKGYVNNYYKTIISGKLEKAYEMLPAESKAKRSKEEYISMHKGLNIKSFKITDTKEKGQTQTVGVSLTMPGFSGWNVVWTFIKHKKGWIAAKSQSAEAKK